MYEQEDKVIEKRECRDCGAEFTIKQSEIDFFNKLVEEGKIDEVILPTRCMPCRRIKKQNRQRQG